MKKKSKLQLFLNIGFLALIVVVLIFLARNSLHDILLELKSTSLIVLFIVVVLGVIYQLVEGQSIRLISEPFAADFSTWDGFFTSCYVAFYRIISLGTGTLVSEVHFYRNKGMKVSQGIGVTALHMVMYKMAVITYAIVGLVIQFSLFYETSPKMIPFILAGVIITAIVVVALIVLSSSLNLQIGLIIVCNRLFKSRKIRDLIDKCNLQIYSLRETVQTVVKDRTALLRIYYWNLFKLLFWYIIPFAVLFPKHPNIDFLQTVSFISFIVVLSGIIPTPGGVGSFEFVYLLLFKPIVGTVDAVSSLLLYRFASFVLPFLIGLVYVVAQRRKVIQEEIHEVRKEKAMEEK